jgi:type I restriction enzyme S subunit
MAQIKSLQTGIKFKDTPIGKIPVDWEVRKLGEVSKVKRGASPRPINDSKWFGGNVGWVRIADVTASKKYLRKTKDYLSDEGVNNSVRIKEGEVILSICATIGRPIIVDMDACIHDGFVWFEGLKEDIDREFFYYFLERNEQHFASQRQTGTQGNLNTSIISNLYFPMPPLHEQKKIAEILTTVDDAIEETDRIIEKTKELKKGLMQRLFTRGIGHKKFKKTEIGEIPVDWEVNKIGEISEVKRGASPRPISDSKWFGGNVGWVRISDVTGSNKYLNMTKDYLSDEGVKNSVRIKKGEVILSICATIGRPIIVNMDACIHDGFVWFDGLRKDINREYFYYYLQLNETILAAKRQTGTQGNLNTFIVENIVMPLPNKEEQEKIAEILSFADTEIEQQEDHKQNLETLKKSLIQILLTGRVRVKFH